MDSQDNIATLKIKSEATAGIKATNDAAADDMMLSFQSKQYQLPAISLQLNPLSFKSIPSNSLSHSPSSEAEAEVYTEGTS